jgi:hypothetical protein
VRERLKQLWKGKERMEWRKGRERSRKRRSNGKAAEKG